MYLPHDIYIFFLISGVDATVFTLQNRCRDIVWPGILTGAGRPQLVDDGMMGLS